MKTIENQGFLTTLNAMGRSVSVETPAAFQKANKINGFVHISYGTALKQNMKAIILTLFLLSPLLCHANSYDDDEKIRRAAQQLADQDQRERDAARKRADDAERANQPHDSGGGWLCFGLVIGVPAFMIWNHSHPTENA